MPLFITAGYCHRIRQTPDRDIKVFGDVVVARSLAEAEGFVLRAIKEKYPSADGWTEYHIDAFPAAVEKLASLLCGDGQLDSMQEPFFVDID